MVVGGGGLLDFKVYLSPLLGEGDRSRWRDSERGFERCRERVPREGERERETRDERGEEIDCDKCHVIHLAASLLNIIEQCLIGLSELDKGLQF